MTTLYTIRGIPVAAVERFWPFALPYIKRALDHANGEMLPSNFLERCLARDVQLWLINKDARVIGAATTEIVQYPLRKHCRIITIAGSNFDEWRQPTADQIETWAREQGCDAIEAIVRKGFVQKLTPIGYTHKQSIVVKELRNIEKELQS